MKTNTQKNKQKKEYPDEWMYAGPVLFVKLAE